VHSKAAKYPSLTAIDHLARLLQQAQNAVGFLRPANQSEHQIITGLTSVIGGVAGISNAAGDRHGTAQGITLQDKHLAVLCVHSCGAVGLCFIEKNLFTPMPLIGGAAIERTSPKSRRERFDLWWLCFLARSNQQVAS
jgi:Abortive infection C-terminus